MGIKTLAHISDLHIGESGLRSTSLRLLADHLEERAIDHVIVTGDITHNGRRLEMKEFDIVFGPLADAGKLTVVPGNHDRIGEDAGKHIMEGHRVLVTRPEGLYVIRIDSTAPHNRRSYNSHGDLSHLVLDEVELALGEAPSDRLVVIAIHHHLAPLPEESLLESLSRLLGWANTRELQLGEHLLELAEGRADLVLHGHRHVPTTDTFTAQHPKKPLVYNAGSTTSLRAYRVFEHLGGALVSAPRWDKV